MDVHAYVKFCRYGNAGGVGDVEIDALAAVVPQVGYVPAACDPDSVEAVEPPDPAVDILVREAIADEVDVHIHGGAAPVARNAAHGNAALDGDVLCETARFHRLQDDVVGEFRPGGRLGVALRLERSDLLGKRDHQNTSRSRKRAIASRLGNAGR